MKEKLRHDVLTTPAISVIVPVYNTEKYLRRCIDSILAQTFTDFELLLVDMAAKMTAVKSVMSMLQKFSGE